MEVKILEIISVNITKGGCGKTTTVQMLGEILSREYRKKVLCIDTATSQQYLA